MVTSVCMWLIRFVVQQKLTWYCEAIIFHNNLLKNILCHSLLSCRVSAEKSADNLMGVLLYVICHFSLVVFNIFCL